MTCREKLTKEHPEYISPQYYGGCNGCPNDYGYLPAPPDCDDISCEKCWDREIPGTEKKKVKPYSYATFKDGHTEEIFYYRRGGDAVMFGTKSGIYVYHPYVSPAGVFGLRKEAEFYRIGYEILGRKPAMFGESNIKSITIDERVPYEYEIESDGVYICGGVLDKPDADEDEIRKLIMDDLDIRYEKKEEE